MRGGGTSCRCAARSRILLRRGVSRERAASRRLRATGACTGQSPHRCGSRTKPSSRVVAGDGQRRARRDRTAARPRGRARARARRTCRAAARAREGQRERVPIRSASAQRRDAVHVGRHAVHRRAVGAHDADQHDRARGRPANRPRRRRAARRPASTRLAGFDAPASGSRRRPPPAARRVADRLRACAVAFSSWYAR